MIEATRRWFRRNRNSLLVGAGVIGAGYLAGQYVLGRIREASQRMRDDKTAKDNLRGRFERNQDDCTYTVLALLPTIRDEIIGALPVEQITEQLQQERQERLKRLAASEAPSSEYPSAPASIVDDASTTSFIHTSQMGMSAFEDSSKPKRSKAQLWQDMKINSIARALALLYTLALLNLLTRIQLNLLGRRTYLASVVSMASPAGLHSSTISLEDRDEFNSEYANGNDFETNRMYLTFSWWILHRGAKSILDRVMTAVKEVFASVNIREDMSMERLSELVIEVRRRVEGSTEQERRQQSWLEYLLPPRNEELFVMNQANQTESSDSASPEPRSNPLDITSISPSLRRLLDETADLIESPTFSLVLGHLLDTGFSHLVDTRIASEAFKAIIPTGEARISEVLDTKCKLAHILPVFCRQAHVIVSGGEELAAGVDGRPSTNEYLVLMDRVHDLEAFAAVIYSSNFEYEVVDSPQLSAVQVPQTVQETVQSVQRSAQQSLHSVQESTQQSLQSAQQTIQSVWGSAQQPIQSVQGSAQQSMQAVQQSLKQSIESVQESVVSLADSSIEKLNLNSQGSSESKSQSVDPLGRAL
ncbi:hypothetical protein AMS68_005369 [Peltaster fructicola]|uniref:Peroxin-3 n=1 Tax=Peltaster fructicola TaxID=286661 RepID=A0A6H0XYJ8_9PEZI|nr:hypothetical protein AMS68_005369 [Peltaster fructicola]